MVALVVILVVLVAAGLIAAGRSFKVVQQYEQGVRRPSGPEAVLLRVVTKEPRAVMRALNFRKAS